jgi:hypothetical protein
MLLKTNYIPRRKTKMKKKLTMENIKEFGKKHSKGLMISGCITGGLIIGYFIGSGSCEMRIASGLDKMYDAGLIDWKVPDGDGFRVVDADEFADYLEAHKE